MPPIDIKIGFLTSHAYDKLYVGMKMGSWHHNCEELSRTPFSGFLTSKSNVQRNFVIRHWFEIRNLRSELQSQWLMSLCHSWCPLVPQLQVPCLMPLLISSYAHIFKNQYSDSFLFLSGNTRAARVWLLTKLLLPLRRKLGRIYEGVA